MPKDHLALMEDLSGVELEKKYSTDFCSAQKFFTRICINIFIAITKKFFTQIFKLSIGNKAIFYCRQCE